MIELLLAFVTLRAEAATLSNDYQHSQQLLRLVTTTEKNQPKILYLKAVNAFALNDHKTASEAVEQFDLVTSSEVPVRYRSLMAMMKYDLEQWGDPLRDIERDMRISGDRLQNAYAGEGTQKIQKQIIDKLDKLIKEEEDKKNQQQKMLIKLPAQPGVLPMPDSLPTSGDSGPGKVTETELRKIGEQWGGLPPEKRAKIVDDITRELPVKYREAIINYFKSLEKK